MVEEGGGGDFCRWRRIVSWSGGWLFMRERQTLDMVVKF